MKNIYQEGKKDFTVNVDIQIYANDRKSVGNKLAKLLKDVTYWIGNVEEYKEKKLTTCMDCGLEAKREVYEDELGEYIVCECGSSCDI